jgi:hypothetical protein
VSILNALGKLQAATSYDDPKLYFLHEYVYELGVNDLVKFGADQCVIRVPYLFDCSSLPLRSYALGEETFKRYQSLVAGGGHAPFVRAAGSQRVVLSARNWTLGTFLLSLETYGLQVD